MSKCIGCGIKLQDTKVDGLGYTKKLDNKYCERCFKTIHYNEERKVNNLDNDKIIDKVNKLGLTTIFITDLISINNDLIKIFKRINNKKVLVINKCDIIPNNLKLEHIEENIKRVYEIDTDIFFISAKKKQYLNKIINVIEKEEEVIMCGETSSGKSTLINNLIDSNLTTSSYSNTTLDFIKLKHLDYVIYDTPGIIVNNSKESFDNIVVKTIQLNDQFVLNIGDLKIRGNGNITFIGSSICNIKTKKEDINLEENYLIEDNSDIELLTGGFLFIKKGMEITSNEKLSVRKSIISK